MPRPWNRKREREIEERPLPGALCTSVLEHVPDADVGTVELALRDWLICCLNSRGRAMAVPSRTIRWLWGEFASDGAAYGDFCKGIFRAPPDPSKASPPTSWPAMVHTVEAWDRSDAARSRDTILWYLDEQLEVEDPIGIDSEAVGQIRSKEDPRYGGPFSYFPGGAGG